GLDAEGRLTALRARIVAPLGAALMNAAAGPPWNHARLLPGAYVVPACDITVTGALTTTTPVAAYRGAGRPEACFFIERLMDTAARALKLDPAEIRRRNFVPPDRFPFRTVTGQVYDSGEYGKALELALAAADYAGLRHLQAERRAGRRRPGTRGRGRAREREEDRRQAPRGRRPRRGQRARRLPGGRRAAAARDVEGGRLRRLRRRPSVARGRDAWPRGEHLLS